MTTSLIFDPVYFRLVHIRFFALATTFGIVSAIFTRLELRSEMIFILHIQHSLVCPQVQYSFPSLTVAGAANASQANFWLKFVKVPWLTYTQLCREVSETNGLHHVICRWKHDFGARLRCV